MAWDPPPMSSPTHRLAALGLRLPPPAAPKGTYAAARIHRGSLWVAGHTDRTATSPPTRGAVGGGVDVDAARRAARWATLNLLAAADAAVGLDAIAGVVFLRGYVVAATGFEDHPQVIDAASELLAELFGAAPAPARAAIGVATLPGGACVELEAVFDLP